MEGINWHTLFFFLFALLACGFALAVTFSANVVRMAFHLVMSLAATAGLFFLAGADFVGAMQVMIYVGGTLVLLIFGVMLTAQGPFITMKTGSGEWLLGLIAGSGLLALLIWCATANADWRSPAERLPVQAKVTAAPLGLGLLGVRVDRIPDSPSAPVKPGLAGYFLPFEIVSVHLLVVLVGAAYLARPKKRATEREED
jgi:NADH-quinone oxidoreductase subunit J